MPDSIGKRLALLREEMAKRNIDFYIIPNSDFHGSEYIGAYFRAEQYVTGFTGSSATAVILAKEAYLWTDGRYFIQAKKQLSGSGILLQRMGEEGVPSVEEWIAANLKEGGCIGFDARVLDAKTAKAYQKMAKEKHASLFTKEDLVGNIWEDRPKLSKKPFFILEEKYCGQSTKEKLDIVRKKLEENGADAHILSSLTDIAWLLNVRGGDILHVPVVLSYLVIDQSRCIWFLQEEVLTKEQMDYLKENGIVTKPYEEVYEFVASLKDVSVLYDEQKTNYRIVKSFLGSVKQIQKENPTELLKAVKNPVELENIKKAHIKDGVAVTKFLYWLKKQIGKEQITELSAASYLEERRREQANFLEPSFDTICAYGANAAMMHYAATVESNAKLEPSGFLLVDSGGHYLEGSTDVTRTIALGELTDSMRTHFTAVLRGNLNLAAAKFLYGCRGTNLDILARDPLWNLGIDYRCGTGHGIGYALNVHEGPNAFRYKQNQGKDTTAVFEAGMVTTNEPGVYIENEYGIRIENELVCKKAQKNEYGQFMQFENITYVPIDLDGVCAEEMTKRERMLLNEYHKTVYETISPYLTEEENQWLKEATRAI